MNRRDQVKKLMYWYFRQAFVSNGLKFDEDNRAEVEEMVDLIFDEIEDSRA